MEHFPLEMEVVHAKSVPELPNYLKQAQTVNTRPIYKFDPTRMLRDRQYGSDISDGEMDFQRFLAVFNERSSTSLEESQCLALKQALMNRVSIIQGICTDIFFCMFLVSQYYDISRLSASDTGIVFNGLD